MKACALAASREPTAASRASGTCASARASWSEMPPAPIRPQPMRGRAEVDSACMRAVYEQGPQGRATADRVEKAARSALHARRGRDEHVAQRLAQAVGVDRLGEEVVHARGERVLAF